MKEQHGWARTPTYVAWINMKQRCDNPNNPAFCYYGDRGIKYDVNWKMFSAFLHDMGRCPNGFTLERINNNLGYNKDNCRWASWSDQGTNKRSPTVYKSSSTGINGVRFLNQKHRWIAQVKRKDETALLYYGKDFFEACCARKSWEAKRGETA